MLTHSCLRVLPRRRALVGPLDSRYSTERAEISLSDGHAFRGSTLNLLGPKFYTQAGLEYRLAFWKGFRKIVESHLRGIIPSVSIHAAAYSLFQRFVLASSEAAEFFRLGIKTKLMQAGELDFPYLPRCHSTTVYSGGAPANF